ncbi:MAG TPA: CcmD family protein [Bryobacteraceae bacterium]
MDEARNLTFLFYGFLAAWVIVLLYVISLARRGVRLKKELEQVKQLFNAAPEDSGERIEERVR